ncbi:hypothetical protein HHI36_006593 [Cryptolaemus montrouzieri]|uniref:Multidrug resistance-associated protein 4-like n=1 Tax=Cryptolaemus montrouzieri TaxID=559131 RepID=A0ABD2NY20_9CUCU
MEESYPLKRENPRKNANILSRLSFLWMRKICYEGNTTGLELKDVYKTQENDKSKKLADELQKVWDKEVEYSKLRNKEPSLLKAIFKAYALDYFGWGLLLFFNAVVIKALQPLVLSGLIKLFTQGEYTTEDVLIYAGGMCVLSLLTTLLGNQINCGVFLMGMRIRVALSSLIYRKILKLSQLSLGKTAAGQVVNLLSNDVARFDLVVLGLNYLWIGPIQVVIVSYLMWSQMGPSSMVGVLTMLIMTVPLQLLLGSLTSKNRIQVARKTDHRVRIMSEILSGIQVIKMYAWETPFEKVVELARKLEVKYLTTTSNIRAVMGSFMIFVERSTLAVTVICYVFLGNEIRADLVYSLTMYFNLLQFTLAIMLPFVISVGAESLVSIKRLREFLLMEEKETSKIISTPDNSIRLKHVDASWVPSTPTLRGLNIKIPPGSLCAVIGPIGSGKSSFLKLLLGELVASSGSIELSGDISYASQEPWLFASTVRNNILFGEEFDKSHYRTVTKVCALEKDFEQFPDGDKTTVGDRGVSLSGGQRARINLARAVYKDSDIYLLDDPLSAVDTKVGRHLFDECILGYLRGKTRILVTHQLQYLKSADIIIVLNKGVIEAQGTFKELSQSDLDFTKLLVAADESQENDNGKNVTRLLSTASQMSTVSSVGLESTQDVLKNDNEEKVESGYEGSSFWAYIRSGRSIPMICLLIFLFLFCQVLLSGIDYWIAFWTSQSEIRHSAKLLNLSSSSDPSVIMNIEVIDNSPDAYYSYIPAETEMKNIFSNITGTISSYTQYLQDHFTDTVVVDGKEHILLTTDALMYFYAFLILFSIFICLTRTFIYFYSCMNSSKSLHNKMFHCLLEAPMRFFDTNPAGRVLNRFSKDMGAIDELLPRSLMDVSQILLIMCGIIVMVAISNPYLLIVMAILGPVFLKIRTWFITVARNIKLIEGVAKSPVFSYVSSSIDGLTTIRATKNENLLMKQFDDHQDVHTSTWYLTVLCSSSFGLWLDFVCGVFVCAVVCGFVILDKYTEVEGSFIGLGISQSLVLVGMLQYGMKQVAEVVNYLTSVERVLEYTQLEREHPLETPKDKKPKEPWPNRGEIVFDHLSLRYVPSDPPVINNLSLEMMPTEKIGIVGRTGAGKSSLIAALFRLAPIEGRILIDGIDTKNLGLKDLRKKLSIIPQEPVLFSASMRYNLDPFNEFSDDKLWDVIEEVELKNDINSLDFMVTEGGSNFSVGQRQLICLARAILRNNRILILDEATANVDPKTDELIQKSIRRKFRNCTVLTIAHRLNTIMDSDKVLVMDSGCKVEFDHPHILLQNPEGYFTKMLLETGPTMTQNLKTIAFEAFQSKKLV